MKRHYFDHNATTPVHPAVLEAVLPCYQQVFGNASSIHHFGQQARMLVEQARRQCAAFLGAKPEEIVFTSGGTEANNLAVFGLLGDDLQQHFITSATEHPAVLNVAEEWARRGGALTILPVDRQGRVSPESLQQALNKHTRLVSIMAINNESGVLQDIATLAALAHEHGALFHTDAVQTPARIALPDLTPHVDLLSLSSHKLYAPKGGGLLFVRKGTPLHKVTFGGHQERDRRPGTENVAAAVALGAACARCRPLPELARLRDHLEQRLRNAIDGMQINGLEAPRASNTSSISFAGVEGEAMVIALDLLGFAVSSGSACSSGATAPSHVLLAMGLSAPAARGALRFSFGESNTMEETDALADAVIASVQRLRRLSPEYAYAR
jgi:cysteine desulfurase